MCTEAQKQSSNIILERCKRTTSIWHARISSLAELKKVALKCLFVTERQLPLLGWVVCRSSMGLHLISATDEKQGTLCSSRGWAALGCTGLEWVSEVLQVIVEDSTVVLPWD